MSTRVKMPNIFSWISPGKFTKSDAMDCMDDELEQGGAVHHAFRGVVRAPNLGKQAVQKQTLAISLRLLKFA